MLRAREWMRQVARSDRESDRDAGERVPSGQRLRSDRESDRDADECVPSGRRPRLDRASDRDVDERAPSGPRGRSNDGPSESGAAGGPAGHILTEVDFEFSEVESESRVHFTREQRRSRRKRTVRARSIYTPRLAKDTLELGRRLFPDEGHVRPLTRSECVDAPRPCPFVSCRHHLYLDVAPRTGSIKLNFPDLEVWELAETCALDVAERGGVTVESLGDLLNVTRERIRQLEIRALTSIHQQLMNDE